ncbi:hypothetical protein KUV85_13915 [Nocardioides panacisoli]|uniref:hypothetical protein n=1 Tax=Nocardioides panacisoli TaxID=627624 RepID=UPI001C6319EE|nr:hypothetical protein [Nocardioides panacisoli]QYJ03416.1 hypothetical protein KUV85_13915 [Nocardioides panacisoli]
MTSGTVDDLRRARRILGIGCTGSGKSTLALHLGELLDLPVTLMDDLMWQPDWRPTNPEVAARVVADRLAEPAWVLDTAYGAHRPDAIARADVVVALDYPRRVSLGRLLRRTARRVLTREPVCNGNVETLRQTLSRDSIIAWHFRTWSQKRDQVRSLLADPAAPPVVRLGHPRDAAALLAALAGPSAR